ncbi:MAG TPA: MFS transporter [Negativicutes bacterium]
MNRMLLKFTVLSISILMMASMGAAPAIADMLAVFKDASPQTMMLMTTAPAITMVLINLLFGKLATLFNRRTLFNTGMAGFLIGGVGPYFLDNLTAIFVMRGILGLGLGILVPLSMVLITDFFEGSEKNTVMGLQSVFVNIGGIIFPALGGFLCAINWRYTFLSYLLGVLVFLLVFYFLPEPAKVQSNNTGTDNVSAKTSLGGKVYFLQAVVFTYSVLLYIFFTNIAIEVVGENIGNAANAGMVMTLFTLGGMLAGFAFGKIMDAINIFTIPLGWFLTGIGMALISTTNNMNLILLGSVLAGVGFTVTAPAAFVLLTNVAPPSGIASAIALVYALSNLGQFISPVLADFFTRQFDQVPGRFPIFASSLAFMGIGFILLLLTRTQFLKSMGRNSEQLINT